MEKIFRDTEKTIEPLEWETEEIYIPPMVENFEYNNQDIETTIRQDQANQTTNYVLSILSFFPYIEPFKINLKGYNWWKIDVEDPEEDTSFLPYFSYISGSNHKYSDMENTICPNDLMKKHKHYLFGLYNEGEKVKFYVYGIPGDFNKKEHPQNGTTGFNTWFAAYDVPGYWLIYIDPNQGRIVYPINPMIPL